ncbi:TetR/AcrR family transcriptional regulator [Bailinhaonella thermotolerans]|uniref:TetR family transcriptional regulator n=1 Tax=Bailinhaonella thermotolerans TaxID=1070861 RepID=A0A3A4ABE1_9ACTN|nr:TetR family transcriptional regulator [Bailinhaonella thermotolerans]RJL24137.1 TetR family transcriptional regulator [Bailinhaonella thermotolerans]
MGSLTREAVLDAAMAIVERQGLESLSMRKLAADLGVAVTAIYWHVGNREALVAQLVDRVMRDLGDIAPEGRTPARRIVSVARSLRRRIHEHPHVIALVYEHGRTALMMLPAERALAREVAAAGLTGRRAAHVVRAILHHVVGHVLLERAVQQSPHQHPTAADLWRDADEFGVDRALARELARPPDPDHLFDLALRALVAGLLQPPPRRTESR